MTVLNDHHIRALSTAPTHILKVEGNGRWELVFYDEADKCLINIQTGRSYPCVSSYVLENSAFIQKVEGRFGDWRPLIEPFVPHQVRTRQKYVNLLKTPELTAQCIDQHPSMDMDGDLVDEKIISYGLSSFGYDLRLGNKFKVFTNINSTIVDPKNFDDMAFVEVTLEKDGDEIIIPPNSFILGYSLEVLTLPRDVVAVVVGKSTLARVGINCLCTPLEPEWSGNVTLEFSNNTPLPAKLYVGEGCCQVMFHRGEPCMVSYADRGGKYMNQGPTPVTPKV